MLTKKSNADSVTNTSVQLYSLPDTVLINTQLVKTSGNKFNVSKFSKYILRISAIGYETIEKNVSITDRPVSLQFILQKRSTAMKAVTVTSRKPLVKQEDDKSVIDVEPIAASSSNAFEVLEKTPGAIVDQDGNVYLNSSSPATIQINGREVKLSAADLSSLLKSLPAGSISKIEIIRSPSAKYDASSSGGIVNIVLKKGVKLGSNGSLNVGYFQGVYSTKFAGFTINKSADKISTYLSYQFTDRNNYEALNSKRIIPLDNSTLAQTAYTTYPALNHYIGAGIDAELSKKFSIAYDGRFTSNDSRSDALNKINISNNVTQQSNGSNQSIIKNSGTSIYFGNNFSTRYKIDSIGSEWTMQFDYNYYKNGNEQLYNNYYYLPADPALLGNGNSNNRKNIFTAQTDLVWKMKKKFTLEAGFKTTVSASHNAADYFYKKGSTALQVDSFQTNTFKYREAITSSYMQLAKTFAGFNIKPGIRMEITDINGRQLVPKDTSLAIQRTDFFPYLYIRHRLAKLFGFELNGNAIYRRSISRPYYEALNPYPKYVDQYLFDVGNPSLRPQFTTNYEFNVIADDFPIFSIGVNHTKDIFSNVTYQDDVTKIAYRTYDNLGTNKELYLRFVGGIPPGGKYFFYAGALFNSNEYNGIYQNLPLSYKRGSWSFFTYQQFKASSTLTFSINGFMRTGGLQNFYELKNFGSLNCSINKKIMDGKGTLVLSGNDILGTNKVEFALNQGNVKASGNRMNDTRKIGLTFRYSFGIKPKEEKKAMFEQPAESN
ncbi:MAG: outer membrane beta-barrel protein [Ferruginibacter sp.]